MSFADLSQCCTKTMTWGGLALIRQNSWKSRTDNVVHTYFHTYGFSGGFSLSFYNVSVSISPTTDQWSVAAFASFSH